MICFAAAAFLAPSFPASQGAPDPLAVRKAINDACMQMEGQSEPGVSALNVSVGTGPRTVKMRMYRPASQRTLPAVLFLHGGGFVGGNLETHDRACRAIAGRVPCLVVAVDYRLAPEAKYPAANEDAATGLTWLRKRAANFQADPNRIAVVGDSAGATLAAGLALKSKAEGTKLALQGLINPALDATRYDKPGYEEYRMFRDWFAPDPKSWSTPEFSPFFAPDLKGLAPAFVVAGEKDALLPETREYVDKLKAAGVPAELYVQPGAGHLGPVFAANAKGAQDPMNRLAAALKGAFGEK